jgi:dipeptidyl aminopeptidase/acylaminoacyl peptidase
MDLVLRSTSDGTETVIAHDDISIAGISWAPDSAHLSYAAGAKSIRHEQTPDYSGAKIIYTITERTPAQTFVVPSRGGKPAAIGTPGGGTWRWVDARRMSLDRQAADYKGRTITINDVTSRVVTTLHVGVDEKFWSIPGGAGPAALPSPDGRWIAFLSDRDGWDLLYVAPAAGGDAIQLTRGEFEAWRPAWSPDSTRIAFDANAPGQPGTRHIGVATIGADPAKASIAMLTTGRGTNIAPIWSPDGTRLVYQHTDPQTSADLFVIAAKAGAAPQRLSTSMPPAMRAVSYVEPEYVR